MVQIPRPHNVDFLKLEPIFVSKLWPFSKPKDPPPKLSLLGIVFAAAVGVLFFRDLLTVAVCVLHLIHLTSTLTTLHYGVATLTAIQLREIIHADLTTA